MRTEVGYTGGSTASPTYERIGDHAEAVDLRFDPSVITYDALLDHFWAAHDPTRPGRSTQYKAAVFSHGPAQRAAARARRDREAARRAERIATEIFHDLPYYPAEAYHQKWRLRRRRDLFLALQAGFPSEAALLASTAAARLNGVVGEPREMQDILHKLDLPAAVHAELRDLAGSSSGVRV